MSGGANEDGGTTHGGTRPRPGRALRRALAAFSACTILWVLPQWWTELRGAAWAGDLLRFVLWGAGSVVALFLGRRHLHRAVPRPLPLPHPTPAPTARPLPFSATCLAATAVLVSLTTFVHLPRTYFVAGTGATTAGWHFLSLDSTLFLLLSWLFVPFFLAARPRARLTTLLVRLLVLGQLLCAGALLRQTTGLAVYSDDHPSFMFRIAEFWGAFPWRENYVPHWNAGVVNNVLVSSGTTGFAWVAAPLFWGFEPHQVYTAALILVQIVAVPWVVAWSLRTLGLGIEGALAGGILALCAGRLFFVWMLHFGTAGAALSWAVLPAAFAFLFAVAVRRQHGPATLLGLVAVLTLLAQWPPSMVVGPAFAVLVLASAKRWGRHAPARRTLLLAGTGTLALLAHTLIVCARGKELLDYTLTAPAAPLGFSAALRRLYDTVGPAGPELHPVVAVLGIAGVVVLPWRRLRCWLVVLGTVLACTFALGPVFFPRLQLERVLLAASSLAIVPAACWLRRLWNSRATSAAPWQAALLALLAVGLVNTARRYGGQGDARYTAIRPSVLQLAEWVRTHVPEDGRLLFAGPNVHAYGRGHIAYLPLLCGREMMACDYYGFPTGMVEMDYPPRAARTRPGGLHGFMKLHGVSHVVTTRRNYMDHFRSRPTEFHEVGSIDSEEGDGFALVEVLGSGGRFLQGTGRVEADFNQWTVTFADPPPDHAVIAYNWHERLRVAPPAELYPYDTGLGATFIGIRPHGTPSLRIRYNNRF